MQRKQKQTLPHKREQILGALFSLARQLSTMAFCDKKKRYCKNNNE